jgi:hypothetical protein
MVASTYSLLSSTSVSVGTGRDCPERIYPSDPYQLSPIESSAYGTYRNLQYMPLLTRKKLLVPGPESFGFHDVPRMAISSEHGGIQGETGICS